MENTPYRYETLRRVLGQHANGLDLRHRTTLAWMMGGLLCAKTVSLGAWPPCVVRQAQDAQSLVRRLSRWLAQNRITVEPLSGPLIAHAVGGWVGTRMSVALETSMVWKTSCLIRLAVLSRGRAVPWGWRGSEPGRAAVSFERDQDVWQAAQRRFPCAWKGVCLAERGFAETPWRGPRRGRGWHCRMRITSTFWL